MATTTIDSIAIGVPQTHGFLLRFVERIVAAQSRRADRIVQAHLAILDDANLERLGYSREDVQAARGFVTYL